MMLNHQRIELAPIPRGLVSDVPGMLQCVEVRDDEEVEWIWTHLSNGSYVSGYILHKKQQNS